MLSRIYVNKHVIKNNLRRDVKEPPLSIRTSRELRRAHEVSIKAKDGTVLAKVVYNPDKPLACGATVWIETDQEVEYGT